MPQISAANRSMKQVSAAYTSMTRVSPFENGRNEKIIKCNYLFHKAKEYSPQTCKRKCNYDPPSKGFIAKGPKLWDDIPNCGSPQRVIGADTLSFNAKVDLVNF